MVRNKMLQRMKYTTCMYTIPHGVIWHLESWHDYESVIWNLEIHTTWGTVRDPTIGYEAEITNSSKYLKRVINKLPFKMNRDELLARDNYHKQRDCKYRICFRKFFADRVMHQLSNCIGHKSLFLRCIKMRTTGWILTTFIEKRKFMKTDDGHCAE